MSQFTFDVSFQRAVLRLCMIDDVFNARVMSYVEASYFTTTAHGWIFQVLKQYHSEYGMRCSDMPLRNAVKHSQNSTYGAEAENVIRMGTVPEEEYIRHELREFIRRSEFARSHRESMQLYNDDKHNDAYDTMREAMDKIGTIDFENVDRTFFFEDLAERNRANVAHSLDPSSDVYTTGWPILDQGLNGGLHKGEVFLILGDAKAGKSTFLVNQAFHGAMLSRAKTLVINLEGSTKLWANRLDSCFSREAYFKVRSGDIDPHTWRTMQEEYKILRGLVVIRTINEWDTSILHIQAELTELKARGFEPDVMVLDYVDLLRSRYPRDSETAHQIDAMKDIKQLANRGLAVWSACQSRRPKTTDKTTKTLLRAKDIADAYGKIRIADGYGSLNSTDEERKNEQSRLFWEAYRDGAVGHVYTMQHELVRQRMGVSFDRLKPQEEE